MSGNFKAATERRKAIRFYALRLSNFVFFQSILFFLLVVPVFPQTVSGKVTDAQNAPVANAEVSVFVQNKIVSQTATDAEGRFSLSSTNESGSILRVRAAGFAFFERRLSELQIPVSIVLQTENLRAEVTISVARTESRLSETPASVVVLDRETLDATAAQTVDDSLRQVPGFALFRRSSSRTTNPTTQGAALRGVAGSGASRASVLLDDLSLNDAFGGWTYWSRVPRAAIEQIEVLRGGASALYGSGAVSGAINIQTARVEEKPILRFETSAGTQGTFDGSVFTGIGTSGWGASVAAESFTTDGYIPIVESERGAVDRRADSAHQNLLARVERKLGQNSRIFLRGNFFRENRENGTVLQNNQTGFRQIAAGADLSAQKLGSLSLRAAVEAQDYDQTFSAVGADRNSETLSREQSVPSQAVAFSIFWTRPFENHTLSGALELRRVRGASDERVYVGGNPTSLVGAGGRENSVGVFAQDFWRATSKLNISFGARFDGWRNERGYSVAQSLASGQITNSTNFADRTESAFSPRVAALYQATVHLSFFASAAKSFRAPTLNELYRAFRVGSVLTQANENLSAERATNFETGANLATFGRKFNLRGTFFWMRVSEPVSNVTVSAAPNLIIRRRQNLGETRSRGFEIDSDYSFRDLRLSAGYSFVDARVTEFPVNTSLIGKFLPQVARHQFTFQAFYRPAKRISLGVQGRISGRQFEDDSNAFELRPYFTADVLFAYPLTKNLEIFSAVENVFNKRYDIGRTPVLSVAAPRSARIGLRWK